MISSLDEYIHNFKIKLSKNMFSPLFVRLANLYYLNKQYEECINTCKTGIEIYPNYLTAKLLLLKAYIKLEYINEAETLLNEIDNKITNPEILQNLRNSISGLKNVSRQERIMYTKKHKPIIEFNNYESKFKSYSKKDTPLELEVLLSKWDDYNIEDLIDKKSYDKFIENLEKIKIDTSLELKDSDQKDVQTLKQKEDVSGSYLSDVKFITETLADIYAKQGNFREAFNTYNKLLKSDNSNKERILKKLSNLESNFLNYRND